MQEKKVYMKMKLFKKLICAVLCFSALMSVIGCSSSQSNGCVELTDSPSTTLDNVWYNPGGVFRCAVFDSLLTIDSDMENISASLAESYEVSEDEKTVTFTLRDGVLWHDGEVFDSNDVLFSVKSVLRSDEINGVISSAFKSIVGAEAYSAGETESISGVGVNGNKIAFRIDGNIIEFIQAIIQFAILPEHILGETAPNDIPLSEYWKKPVGTGCYRIVEAVENEYFLLEANNSYFGKKPGIKNMRIHLNKSDCVTAMKEGSLDFYVTNDPGEISKMKGADNCSDHRLNILFPAYLIMNFSEDGNISEYLKDERVRRALLIAIDREVITEAIFPGSSVSNTLVPTWDSWYWNDAQVYEYNPEKARELLVEAGFDFSRTLRLRYSTKGQSTADLMSAIAVYWQEIGIKVDLQKFDGSGSEHMFNIRDFDVCYKRLSAFDRPSIYEEISGDSVMQQSLLNMPIYDELINELSLTNNESRRKEIVCLMQQLDQEYLLRLPLFSLANVAYVNDTRLIMPDVYGNLWYRYDLCFSEWRLKQ